MKTKFLSIFPSLIVIFSLATIPSCAVAPITPPTTQSILAGLNQTYNDAVAADATAILALNLAYDFRAITPNEWVNTIAPAQAKFSKALAAYYSAYTAALDATAPNVSAAKNELNVALAVLQSLANSYPVPTGATAIHSAPPVVLTPPPALAD